MRCRPLQAKKDFDLIYLSMFSGRFARKFAASLLGFHPGYKLNNVQFTTCVFPCLVPQTFNFILLIRLNLISMSDGVKTMRIMEVNYLLFFQAALYLARAAGELLTAKQNT